MEALLAMRNYFLLSGLFCALLALLACGEGAENDAPPSRLSCEEGTAEENGRCVPLDSPDMDEEDAGEDAEDMPPCPDGTVEEGGACVEPPLECPDGTVEEDGECVEPSLECPEGTVERDGACVSVDDLCPDGESWVDGACVPDPEDCEEGEIWDGERCVPLPPEGEAEPAEPNDPRQGGEAGSIILQNVEDRVHMVGELGGDDLADVFVLQGQAGERFRLSLERRNETRALAFSVRFLPLEGREDPGFIRGAFPFDGEEASRELILPFTGRYEVRIADPARVAMEMGLEGAWEGPVSTDMASWSLRAEQVRNPVPERFEAGEFSLSGRLDDLIQARVSLPEGTLLTFEMSTEYEGAQPLVYTSSVGYEGHRSGVAKALVGPEDLLISVDHFWVDSENSSEFQLQVKAPPVEALGQARPGQNLASVLEFEGNAEQYLSFQVTEPILLTLEAEAVADGADPSLRLLGPDLEPMGESVGGGLSETLLVYALEPGTYLMDVRNDGVSNPDEPTPIQVVVRGVEVHSFDQVVLNSPAESLSLPSFSLPGAEAWFAVETDALGTLGFDIVQGEGVDTRLFVARGPLLAVRGAFLDRVALPAAEPEIPVLPGLHLIHAVNVAEEPTTSSPLGLEAILLNGHPVVDEVEPNQLYEDASGPVVLDNRPAFVRGELSAEDSRDLYRFSLSGASSLEMVLYPGESGVALDEVRLEILDARGGELYWGDAGALRVDLPAGDYALALSRVSGTEALPYFATLVVERGLVCVPGAALCEGPSLLVCRGEGDAFVPRACDAGVCDTFLEGISDCGARERSGAPNDSREEATPLGALEVGRTNQAASLDGEDWYSFSLAQGGLVTLATRPEPGAPAALDTVLSLWSGDEKLAEDDHGGGRGFSRIDRIPLEAGDYLAQVEGEGEGFYRLSLDVEPFVCPPGVSRCDGQVLSTCEDGLRYVQVEVCEDVCQALGNEARCSTLGEPNNGPLEASVLGLPASFEADIQVASDQDWYRFEVNAPVELTFEVLPIRGRRMANTRIFLCEAAAAEACQFDQGDLARNDDIDYPFELYSSLQTYLPEAGIYYAVVEAIDGTRGDYALNLLETGEPNENASEAREVGVPSVVRGRVESSADQDWYSFSVEEPGRVIFTTSGVENGGNLDTQIWLCGGDEPEGCSFDEGFLAVDDNGGLGLFSKVAFDFVQPGTYYLGVRGFGGSRGAYALDIRQDAEPNDDASQATPVPLPYTLNASIGVSGDEDWYRMDVVARESLVLETRPLDGGQLVNTQIWLCEADNAESCSFEAGNIAQADDGVFPQYSRLPWTPQVSGTYYLGVRAVGNGTGDYQLALVENNEPDDTPEEAARVNLPLQTPGRISPEGDRDWYSFTLEGPALIQAETRAVGGGEAVNTRLFLCDDGDLEGCRYRAGDLANNDNADATTRYSRIVYEVQEAGTYYIAVESADGGTGNYDLILAAATEPDNTPAQASRVQVPGLAIGQIAPGDVDWFTWTLTEPLSLHLETQALGNGVDTRIWVCSSQNPDACTYSAMNLGSDDNSGEGSLSALDLEFAFPGVYYVAVEGAGGNEGGYQLLISEQGEPDNVPEESRPLEEGTALRSRIWPLGDVDWYSFSLGGPSRLRFDLEAPEGGDPVDARFYLCEVGVSPCSYEEGAIVTWRTATGPTFTGEFDEAVDFWMAVEADPAGGAELGHYRLRVSDADEPDNRYSQSRPLDVPGAFSGRLGAGEDQDWFRFSLESPANLVFETRPVAGAEEADTKIFVCEAGVAESCTFLSGFVTRDDNAGRGRYSKARYNFSQGGDYAVVVQGAPGGEGFYQLLASVSAEPNDDPATAQAVELPVYLETDIERGDDVDWYVLETSPGDDLRISTRAVPGGDDVDTRVWICGGLNLDSCSFDAGNLGADDNGGDGLFSSISYEVQGEGGLLYIAVDSFGFGGGEYALVIE